MSDRTSDDRATGCIPDWFVLREMTRSQDRASASALVYEVSATGTGRPELHGGGRLFALCDPAAPVAGAAQAVAVVVSRSESVAELRQAVGSAEGVLARLVWAVIDRLRAEGWCTMVAAVGPHDDELRICMGADRFLPADGTTEDGKTWYELVL